MKLDILRRVEATEQEDDEDDDEAAALAEVFGRSASGNKGKGREVAFEEELDSLDVVAVAGDGEATDEESEANDDDNNKSDPHKILELAYIADPSVFNRDAETKRSKRRAELRAQTGKGFSPRRI